MINRQHPEHKQTNDDGKLDVHSIFDTIQGEGPYAGVPAIFIRLAGCNLICEFCDTDYTSERKWMSCWEITEDMKKTKEYKSGQLVVITGGEPFRQRNLGTLVNALLGYEYRVQIETNGTLYQPGPWVTSTIVCSPKTPELNNKIVPLIDAYKYVLSADDIDPDDGLPCCSLGSSTIENIARPPRSFKGPIYLQPLDVQDEAENWRNVSACIQSCKRFGYTFCLQMHKIINLP